jgi:glycosyltransferase involved in cell wall biosynthesis
MKIVHITLGHANPDTMNGVNKVVHDIAGEMARQRIDVEVWGVSADPVRDTPGRSYPLHVFEGRGRSLAVGAPLREAIEALPVETCVHFHGVFIPVFFSLSRLLKKRGIPWIVSPHGAYMPLSRRKNFLMKWVYSHTLEAFILRNARAIHACTALERAVMKRWVEKTPIRIVPNGYVHAEATRGPAHEVPPRNRPVFGYMGRVFMRHKGLDILLKGFALHAANGGKGQLGARRAAEDRQVLGAGEDVAARISIVGRVIGARRRAEVQVGPGPVLRPGSRLDRQLGLAVAVEVVHDELRAPARMFGPRSIRHSRVPSSLYASRSTSPVQPDCELSLELDGSHLRMISY